MLKNFLLAVFAWLFLCCAVNAQGVPGGWGMGVPPTAPLAGVNQTLLQQNALDVTKYGVQIDGRKGYFYASWTKGSPTLSLYSFSASVTASGNTITASISNAPATNTFTGNAFQPDTDVGLPICVQGTGGNASFTYQGVITGITNSGAAQVSPAIAGSLSGAAGTLITLPCPTQADVGKSILVDQANVAWGLNGGALNYAQTKQYAPFVGQTISAVTAPSSGAAPSITLSGNFPYNNNNATTPNPVLVVWGTDNTNSLLAAAQAAVNAGQRYLYFPSNYTDPSPGIVTAFGIGPQYTTLRSAPAGMWEFMGKTIWLGQNVRGYFTDLAGMPISKQIVPISAGAPTPPRAGVFANLNLARTDYNARTNNTINIVVFGDSQCGEPVQPPNPASISEVEPVIRALQRAYPNVVAAGNFNVVNRCIPGATFAWLDSIPPNGTTFPSWYTVQSNPWISYVSSIPVGPGGATSNVTPDLVLLFNNGGNDNSTLYLNAMYSVINKIQAFTALNGLPPDIMMITTKSPSVVRNGTGTTVDADYQNFQQGYQFSNMLIRTAAEKKGLGFIDLEQYGGQVHLGWDPMDLMLRTFPNLPAQSVTPTAPLQIGTPVYDYKADFVITAANGAAAWPASQTWSCTIGNRPDNVVILGVDGSGYLTVQVNLWGHSTTTSITTTTGASNNVTTPTGSTSSNTLNAAIQRLYTPPFFALSSGVAGILAGSWVVLPGGQGFANEDSGVLRSFVVDKGNSQNFLIADSPAASVSPTAQTVTYGTGPFFQPSDANAKNDITITGAGAAGATYIGKVTGYTSLNQVSVTPSPGTALTGSSQTVFLGHISVPQFSSQIQASGDAGANPFFGISIQGDTLVVTYTRATDASPNVIYRGIVERAGGMFLPTCTPSTAGPFTLSAQNIFVGAPWAGNELSMTMPQLLDIEMWGVGDNEFGYRFGGTSAHPTAAEAAKVNVPVIAAQQFAH